MQMWFTWILVALKYLALVSREFGELYDIVLLLLLTFFIIDFPVGLENFGFPS